MMSEKSKDFVASYLRASAGDWLGHQAFLAALSFLRRLPLERARELGSRLGLLAYSCDIRWKPRAIERVRELLNPPDPPALVQELYCHFGKILAELAHTSTLVRRWTHYFEFQGGEWARELKKGGLLVTAHLGNWEGFAVGHVRRFGPVCALVKPLRNAYLHSWITRLRLELGVEPIITRNESFTILKRWKEKATIVVLLDQNSLREEGVFTYFFQRLACTHYGPLLLALKARVPIVPGFGVRTTEGGFILTYEPPLEIPRGDLREQVYALTQRLTSRIEEWVRAHPEQWFWVHDRFRTQPDDHTPTWKLPPELQGRISTPYNK